MEPVLFEEIEFSNTAGSSTENPLEKPSVKGPKKYGMATLNTEKSLNALSLEMIQALSPKLDEWENDPQIKFVFLQGSGSKAFCAGGDIRKLYEAIREAHEQKQKSIPYAEKFFVAEYTLDHKIHSYRKPLIVWGHGIVMGGGLGLMAGATARLVTETSMLAMPEISIGLYPDVGATYFLNKMPAGLGHFLGLTAYRMHAADALFSGLADFYLSSDNKSELLKNLEHLEWTPLDSKNKTVLNDFLKRFCNSAPEKPSELTKHIDDISTFANCQSIFDFSEKLTTLAMQNPFFERPLKTFLQGSPTSLHVIFEQLKRGKNLTLNDVFAFEAAMTVQFALHHDFQEGIRALIIDKDNKPNWMPSTLEDISSEHVNNHFRSPWPGDANPLRHLRSMPTS